VGSGSRFSIADPVGSILFWGMMLPGNGAPVFGSVMGMICPAELRSK